MLVVSISVATAGNPKKKSIETQTFKTDIVCQSCEKKIMNNVSVLGKGVKDVKVDLATKEVTVTYDAAKTTPEKLVKGFSKLDIQATPKAAGEASAATGKSCCGKGGGCAGMKTACDEKATTDARPACRAKDATANTVPEKGCCKKAETAEKKSCCKAQKTSGCSEKKEGCQGKSEGCQGKKEGCGEKKACCCKGKAKEEQKAEGSCCKKDKK